MADISLYSCQVGLFRSVCYYLEYSTVTSRSSPSISLEMQALLLERNVSVATLDEDVKLQVCHSLF